MVVTLNHRLGVLGYLDLSSHFGDEYAASGNAGMLDLVLALEWVRGHIAAFGGDPGNVTIFGESGGGYKVSTLLAMPAARGLFHRAIVQSGPGLQARAPETAAEVAAALLDELGTPDLAALQAMPVDQLLAAQRAVGARLGAMGAMAGFGPVRDGVVLPEDPGRRAGGRHRSRRAGHGRIDPPRGDDVPLDGGHERRHRDRRRRAARPGVDVGRRPRRRGARCLPSASTPTRRTSTSRC